MPVRTGLNLATLLDRFPEVWPEEGGTYVVTCPAHADGHPSLVLTLREDRSLLMFCRAGCKTPDVLDALDLTMGDLSNVTPGEGIEARTSTPKGPTSDDLEELGEYLDTSAHALMAEYPGSDEALDYLLRRFGVSRSLAGRLGLGFDPGGYDLGHWEKLPDTYRQVPRLVVPFRGFDGRPRYLQARALRDARVRWCGPSGAGWSRLAYFASGSGYDTTVVTEGPGDALTVVAAGWDAVAIRGAALGRGEVVAELADGLKGHRIVVAGDNDAAGQRFAADLGAALAAEGLTVAALALPEGVKDISEWYSGTPIGAFPAILEEAIRQAQTIRKAPRRPAGQGRGQGPSYPLTDLGNARRLRDHLGLVRYAPEAGFYLWDGSTWYLDRLDAVRTEAHDVTEAMVEEAVAKLEDAQANGDPQAEAEAKALFAWGRRSQSSRAIDTMVKELGALRGVAIDVEQMDRRHDLLAFRNGVVDLRTGELGPHDPGLLLSRCLPYDYDPSATCPRWERFLAEVFPDDPTLPDYMRRLVGYGITGETSEQCFVVLHGTGANGKSVFTDTLTEVFRPITVTTPFSTFEERPSGGIPNDLAALKGARLVMASEGGAGKAMAEAVIKRVTGKDLISARFMRREFFEFRPTFLILLATNHRPTFKGQDEGLWRRVKLVPWTRYFPPSERDHYLGDVLLREAAGIAAWAVRGAVEWYRDGLRDPESVRSATSDYRATSNRLDGFLPGVLEMDPEGQLLGAEVYKAYTEWADAEGLADRETWTRQALYGALEERGVRKRRVTQGMALFGISWAKGVAAHDGLAHVDGNAPRVTRAHGLEDLFTTETP